MTTEHNRRVTDGLANEITKRGFIIERQEKRIVELELLTTWQPIVDAPEDIAILLIEKYDSKPFVGYRKNGFWFENIVNAEVVGDAYIRTRFNPEWLCGWMPLPLPPTTPQEG